MQAKCTSMLCFLAAVARAAVEPRVGIPAARTVPDLTGEDGGGGRAFRPASVLLCVAGTGIVALPQLLAHRDPMKLLGISTPRRDQLHVPIDLVYSCREDDVLMLPQLAQWCRDSAATGFESSAPASVVRLSSAALAR